MLSRNTSFKLTAADGAIGGHANAAREAYFDFALLAGKIAAATEMKM